MIYRDDTLNLRKIIGKKYAIKGAPAATLLLVIFIGGLGTLTVLSFLWGEYLQGALFALPTLVMLFFLVWMMWILILRPEAVLTDDRLYFGNANIICRPGEGISAYGGYKGYVYYSDIERAEYVPCDKHKSYAYANRVHIYAGGKAIVIEAPSALARELTKRIANPPAVEKQAPTPMEVSPLWQEITEDFENGRLEAILPSTELVLESCKYQCGGYVDFMSHKDEIVFSVNKSGKIYSVVLTEDEIFLTEGYQQRDEGDPSNSIKKLTSTEEVYKTLAEFVNKEVIG